MENSIADYHEAKQDADDHEANQGMKSVEQRNTSFPDTELHSLEHTLSPDTLVSMMDNLNSSRPISTTAELKGGTKRGELISVTTLVWGGYSGELKKFTTNELVQGIVMHTSLKNKAPNQTLHFASISGKMVSLRELTEDVSETMRPDSSASSSARDNGGEHPTASSSSSSSEETPSREEGMGDVVSNVSDQPVIEEWESKTIAGRLSNLRKAPKDLPAGFRFKAVLHHEVADCAPSISGYRKLEEMVRAHHIPRTILLQTGAKSDRACTVSQMGWIPVYVDHFKAGLRFPLLGLVFDLLADYELALTQLTPNSIRFIIGFMLLCARLEVPAKAIVFRSLFQCRLCPNSKGAKWYYLSRRDKSQLFKNVRNKVARWKRQFIFVHNMRTERISNDLAARLSEWRTPNAHVNYPQLLPRDVDLKNQLLEYAKRENLIDLKALVTSEHLAVFGFVDVTNLFSEGEMSSILERQRQRAQGSQGRGASSTSQRQTRFDERSPPVPQSRSSSHRGSSSGSRPRHDQRTDTAPSARRRVHEETESGSTCDARSPNASSTTAWVAAEPASASTSVLAPRIAYPDGFSYVKPECQPAMVQGMHSFVPPADRLRAKSYVQQHGGQVAMIKLMDAFSYVVAMFESEQAARSQNNELSANWNGADELAHRNNELREELERARTKKESGIQAAKEEVARVEERAKKVEADRDRAQRELRSLRHQVAEANRNLNATRDALNELKTSHAHSVSIARAQGAEWFVGSAAFQDAMAMASINVTTEIYNEIHGKVMQHRPDFPIGELAFFDGEDLDEQGKSLAPLADATVRLRWDLNEEGVPVWPHQVLEDGEDPAGMTFFDAWVEGAPVAEQEPSSTPPNSQPAVVSPPRSPINAPAREPAIRSPLACSSPPAADASMPVDLTDD
ncbi:hypothetical protein SLEP1_g38264 [Rubroshorea leprosula]|uniref:Transposase (putative) gypsy type domain-containing protein n=1 Tax=Rubroshorea leprosula TaxID=152421 RepID=A0AAV5KXH8_9ROSI|nr:hypothetical protein SLEP1_g38264 [Rubroshorea leprosula]